MVRRDREGRESQREDEGGRRGKLTEKDAHVHIRPVRFRVLSRSERLALPRPVRLTETWIRSHPLCSSPSAGRHTIGSLGLSMRGCSLPVIAFVCAFAVVLVPVPLKPPSRPRVLRLLHSALATRRRGRRRGRPDVRPSPGRLRMMSLERGREG